MPTAPRSSTAEGVRFAVTAAAALAWNLRVGPALGFAPRERAIANAVVAVAFTGVSAAFDSSASLGLNRFADGLRWGAGVSAVPVGASAVAAVVPAVRRRVASLPPEDAPGEWIALRIPLGTVVCEELIFRSALDAAGTRAFGRVGSVLAGAVVFGLWHVPVARGSVATLVGTGAGGLLFGFLRHRSGSVVAPALVHYALNAGGAALRVVAARDARR